MNSCYKQLFSSSNHLQHFYTYTFTLSHTQCPSTCMGCFRKHSFLCYIHCTCANMVATSLSTSASVCQGLLDVREEFLLLFIIMTQHKGILIIHTIVFNLPLLTQERKNTVHDHGLLRKKLSQVHIMFLFNLYKFGEQSSRFNLDFAVFWKFWDIFGCLHASLIWMTTDNL